MANIRVTCPTCKTELEVGAEHAGQEVECGNCLQVFVAKGPERPEPKAPAVLGLPGPAPKPKPKPKRRRDTDDDEYDHDRRPRDDDFDDYDDYRPSRASDSSGADGLAVASLVLGILSLPFVCCWPLGVPLAALAVVMGAVGLRSRDNHGLAVAGLVLGLVSLCLLAFAFFVGFGGWANPWR